jgi:hypothetical protein
LCCKPSLCSFRERVSSLAFLSLLSPQDDDDDSQEERGGLSPSHSTAKANDGVQSSPASSSNEMKEVHITNDEELTSQHAILDAFETGYSTCATPPLPPAHSTAPNQDQAATNRNRNRNSNPNNNNPHLHPGQQLLSLEGGGGGAAPWQPDGQMKSLKEVIQEQSLDWSTIDDPVLKSILDDAKYKVWVDSIHNPNL